MLNNSQHRVVTLLLATIILNGAIPTVQAQSISGCENYPYQPMESVLEFDSATSFKIITTGAAAVDFDEPSEIMNARREAELLAKRKIAEYITQTLTSEDAINSEVSKSKSNSRTSDGKEVSTFQREEAKKQLSNITSRSESVLKGTLVIGSCYTKGQEVRVTVGIKSQTVANADVLAKDSKKIENAKRENSQPEEQNTKQKS